MLKIELFPDLSSCIETTAKNEFKETLQRIFSQTGDNEELLEKAETLSLFLQTADFKKLRAESEALLIQGLKVKFIVYLQDGILNFRMYKGMKPCGDNESHPS
jgi:hypothetical protein